MKSFHVHPDHLKRSSGKLGDFSGKLAGGGKKLEDAGQKLVSHAGKDRSGIGAVISKVFGKGLGITGKVFGEGGRVTKGAGDRLHGAGNAYEKLDGHGTGLLKKLHPEAKNAGPMHTAKGGASHVKGGKGSSGKRGGVFAGRHLDDKVRPASIPPKNKTCTKDPVDLATGDVLLAQTDVELPSVLALTLARTHLSSYRVGRSFGPSWACTLDQRLEVDAERVVFVGADGVLLSYPTPTTSGDAVYAEEGPRWPLRRADDGYVVEDVDTGRLLRFPDAEPVSAGGDPVLCHLAVIADRPGNRIDIDRTADGAPSAVRHSGGYHVDVSIVDERIAGFSLRDGDTAAAGTAEGDTARESEIPLVRFRYDEQGNLAEVVNRSDQVLRFSYDAAGRLTEWADRNGMWYRYHYDHEGRCVVAEGAGGNLTATLSYDRENLITSETNSLGHITRYHFNDALQAVKTVDPLGGETVSEFDRYDRLLSRTDPLGRTTRFEYSEAGDLTRVTRPDGSQVVAEHNDDHLPVTVIDPDGAVWRREFDSAGNLLAETDPAGASTRYAYTERGHLVSVTDALGATTTFECDPAGLPVRATDPLGANSFYARDGFGRIAAVTDPAEQVTRFSWTVDGQLSARVGPDGTSERWDYDGEGNRISYTDALGQVTTTEYAGFDLPVAEIGVTGARTVLTYDTESQLTSVTDPAGLVWRFEYDPAGNLVSETDVNGRTQQYTRDAAGQTVAVTNGLGETTQIVRDALGRPAETRAVDGVTTFEFDEADRLIRATNPDADLLLRRDSVGRIVAETCNGRTLTNTFDALGQRTRRVTPTGAVSEFHYDPAGRLAALLTAGQTMAFGYDAAGRETSRQLGAVLFAQTWDANHRLRTQALTASTAGRPEPVQQRLVQRRAYTYREDGAVTNIVDQLAGVRRFDLDQRGRVAGVDGPGFREEYGYDASGNLTNAAWPDPTQPASPVPVESVGAQGQRAHVGTLIRTSGRVRYEHDAQGRLTARHSRSLSGQVRSWRYVWNGADRLVAVSTPDGVTWRYLYDALGRRIAKIRLTPDGQAAERTDFSWDAMTLAEQTHSTGHTTAWNYQPDGFTPLAQTERIPLRDAPQEWIDQQFYGIITDIVGAPAELVDAQGNLAWRNTVTLWGEALFAGRQPGNCPLRFPGQYHDAETGQNYNVHRYYSPADLAFTSADPIGLDGGANPHAYVPNPIGWIDPLGLTPEECKLGKALKGWRPKKYQFGKEQFTLDRPGMQHILTRHHPEYWDGSVRQQQSFFHKKTTIPDVEHNINEVLKQNRENIINGGRNGQRRMQQMQGTVDGKTYVLGLNGNRVGQFYPL